MSGSLSVFRCADWRVGDAALRQAFQAKSSGRHRRLGRLDEAAAFADRRIERQDVSHRDRRRRT